MDFFSGYGDSAQGAAGSHGADLGQQEGLGASTFASDPYCQDDAVVRGVNLGLSESQLGSVLPGNLLFGGSDYYGVDSKQPTFGKQLNEGAGLYPVVTDEEDIDWDDVGDVPPPPPAEPGQPIVAGAPRRVAAPLAAGAAAPRISNVPFAFLSPTSTEVLNADPADVANAVQDCFAQSFGVTATVTATAAELSIEAQVKHQFVDCSAKFLIYEAAPQRLIVEVRRQSGDAYLFCAVFKRWKEYLSANNYNASAISMQAAAC